jgi:prevent-host-death family protein
MPKLIRVLGAVTMRMGPIRVVNVHQAKTHLSRLIDEAHAGETIVLAKAGKPWARLMPLAPPAPQRIPGRLRSRGPLSEPDVLLVPMDSSDLESWESGPVLPEAPQP